jgi:NAD(P)-dependent dehydrogenase (short-subunit alcohol dehydrogenase family)
MASDLQDFTGRCALITGAASGIGAACARWLEQRGVAELALVDIDGHALETAEYRCEVRNFVGNVGDPALWSTIAAKLHSIDHAVLNAGIVGSGAEIAALDFADWRQTLSVNLDGVFLGLKTSMALMTTKGGSVVLSSSVSGIRGVGTADYGASKAAIAHLARIAAREGGPSGIRINAIAPGGVDTPIWDAAPWFAAEVERLGSREAVIAEMGKPGTPLGRFATAEEIAGHIGFLLSDQAAMITGHVLVSDGGFSI